jgi:hypothetical protein
LSGRFPFGLWVVCLTGVRIGLGRAFESRLAQDTVSD